MPAGEFPDYRSPAENGDMVGFMKPQFQNTGREALIISEYGRIDVA